ncbi:MAG: hypothetical protein JWP61_237, partial [Friedmanniella sp.]|nr:hypothetical protein [Friedmanniella sp.]
ADQAAPRPPAEVTVSATRALSRAARWAEATGRDPSDLVTTLFGSQAVEVPAVDPGPHPDLAHHLRRL